MIRQIGWGSAFLVAVFFALRTSNGKFAVPKNWLPVPYFFLLTYALLSVIWSEQPIVSIKRSVQLLGVLFVALALVRHRRDSTVLSLFSLPGMVLLLVGAALAIVSPTLAFDSDGNYKAFTYTKNVWGQFTLLMALVFMFQALSKKNPKLNWWLFAFAAASLFATRSTTSISIFAVAISIVLIRSVSKRYGIKLRFIALTFSIVSISMAQGAILILGDLSFDTLLGASLGVAGKDATLTGRTQLWLLMSYEIARHPWFGAGYGGFWAAVGGPSKAIVTFFSWGPGQAHNGYIDVINELGFVGLALLLAVLVAHIQNIYLLSKRNAGLAVVVHFTILVSTLLLNISESSLMRTTHLWWIVLTTSLISAHVQRFHLGKPATAEPRVATYP